MDKFSRLFLVLSLFSHNVKTNPIYGGVLEGKIIKLHEYQREVNPLKTPYIVYIDVVDLKDSRPVEHRLHGTCAGVIIGARTVLTAAHCFTAMQQPGITIFAGVLNLEVVSIEKPQINKGEKYIVHNDFTKQPVISNGKREVFPNDLAIIRTTHAFDFRPSIKVAVLAGSRSKQKIEKGWIYGWGETETGEDSDHLRKAQMNVCPLAVCENTYKRLALSNSQWCLTSDNRRSASCPGDSGGPLVVNGVVYGIFAVGGISTDGKTGKRKCDHYLPSVYINIIKNEKWIKETVKSLAPVDFKNYLKFDDGNKLSAAGKGPKKSETPLEPVTKPSKGTIRPQQSPARPPNSKSSTQQQVFIPKSHIQQPKPNKKMSQGK